MDRYISFQRPLRFLFILTLCLGSLAIHFIAENVGPSDWSSVFELAEHGGDIDPTHESHEDTFVLPVLGRPELQGLFMTVAMLMALHFSSIQISPLLPPPNTRIP
jgi:hypothetical protein